MAAMAQVNIIIGAVRRGDVPNDEPAPMSTNDDDTHASDAREHERATSSGVSCSTTSAAATNQSRGQRLAAKAHRIAAKMRGVTRVG